MLHDMLEIDHLPRDIEELREMIKKTYMQAYLDGGKAERDKMPQAKWHRKNAGSNIIYSLRAAKDEIEGLPTVAIAELLDQDIARVRAGLREIGYKQRSARYKGNVVKGWFMKPARPRIPAGQDEDLPI